MSILTSTWHELVRRRLLPVAILLLAALVAVPLLLAKDAEPAAPVAAAGGKDGQAAAAADAAATTPVVSLVGDGERTKRRRVLGARKNPFEPAPVKVIPAKTAQAPAIVKAPAVTQTGGASTGGTSPTPVSGGTGGPPAATPITVPSPTAPATKPKRQELYSLTVRFGDSEAGSLEKFNLPRLKALPSAEEPVLVYLGPGKDAKTAIFIVDEAVHAQGDGSCKPSPANCETIHLREGDTEFLDVTDENGVVTAQYELDLLKIKRSSTASAAKAAEARAKESKAGRRVLRARQAASGPLRYRYDAESGTVRRVPERAYKAAVAKVARVALGVAGGF